MATLTTSPCSTFYSISLDEAGFPISGTMMARSNNKIPKGYKCRIARLTPYQMVVPAGQTRCVPRDHRRFFYLVNSQTNAIVPNSFSSRIGKPVSGCTGVNKVLEYIPLSSNVNDPE